MCYIGKASKIFLVLVTVLVVVGLIVGFILYHHHQLPKSQKCENGTTNCGRPIFPDPTANSSPPSPGTPSADFKLPYRPPPEATESSPNVNIPPPEATESPPNVNHSPPEATESPPNVNHSPPEATESPPNVNDPPPAITTPISAGLPPPSDGIPSPPPSDGIPSPPLADGILSPAPMGPPGTGSQAQGPDYSP